MGLALVIGFVVLQGVGVVLVKLAGIEIDLTRISTQAALGLLGVQLLQIACAAALIPSIGSRAAVGLEATRPEIIRGSRALLPILILMLGLPMVLLIGGEEPFFAPGLDVPRIVAFIALAIGIAVNEELWFRGLLVAQLGDRAWPTGTILVSALLFGLPHLSGGAASLLNAAAVTLAVGIPFAAVRIVARSLVPLIALHALIDVWAFLHTGDVQPQGDPTAGEIVASLVLPGVLAVSYLVWVRLALRPDREPDPGLQAI